MIHLSPNEQMDHGKEELRVESQIKHNPNENKENDFIDFIVGASVSGGLLFGIFIVATVFELI
jgi:hypothetical protein